LAAAVQSGWLPALSVIVSRLEAKLAESALQAEDSRRGTPRPQPPFPVEVATARVAKATQDIEAVGSLLSDESVEIASEIAGRVAEISFKEGQPVEEGATLVKLDDRLARAEVDDAKARFDLAAANNERAKALSQRGHVAGRAADEAVSNFETAQAALELARVRLSKHELKAPFSGVVGTRRVSPGAYLSAGAPIVNLEKIDTLKVDFKIPETFLGDVAVGQDIELTVDALTRRTFEGEIYAIDPQVDVNGPLAPDPGPHRQPRARPEAGSVRAHPRQGPRGALGRDGAGERHRAARGRKLRLPGRERPRRRGEGQARRAA
jgi:membrane fusion protein (multidrug efflux system)